MFKIFFIVNIFNIRLVLFLKNDIYIILIYYFFLLIEFYVYINNLEKEVNVFENYINVLNKLWFGKYKGY